MTDPVKSRPYDGASRREASAQTRRRILAVAGNLIVEHGYRATTIRAIAADAGVSVATVYELVGRKPEIVSELVELALSGTDQAIPGADRSYVSAMRAEPDAVRKIQIYAAAITEIQARLAPLFLALREAGSTEPAAASVWAAISQRRAANMRHVAADIAGTGRLRADLDLDDAADTIWALNSPEVFVLLTRERGWTGEHFERWLTDTLTHALLDP